MLAALLIIGGLAVVRGDVRPGNPGHSSTGALVPVDAEKTPNLFDRCATATPPRAQELDRQLMSAAKSGDLQAATALLAKGANPNARVPGTWLNYTPLLQAIAKNRLEIVKLLLEHGADLHLEDANGDPALFVAADVERAAIFELLLARGLPIGLRNSKGSTILARTIRHTTAEDLQLLIDHGADPNYRLEEGRTPLMIVAQQSRTDVTRVLIQSGVKLEARDENGRTALLHALAESQQENAAVLIEAGADIGAQDKEGETALRLAISGNASLAQLLLDRGADVNARTAEGETALMRAAWIGSVDTVKLLLDWGAEVNARAADGATALHLASSRALWFEFSAEKIIAEQQTTREIIDLLASTGGDVLALDDAGSSALHYAAQRGTPGSMLQLLGYRLDATLANRTGETPLHFAAARSGDLRRVKLLVAHGATIDAKNADDRTPLSAAIAGMHATTVRFFLENGGSVALAAPAEHPILLTVARLAHKEGLPLQPYTDLLAMIAEKAPDIDARDATGMTALIWVAAANARAAMEVLLARGAQIEAQSKDGRTALMWAASTGAENAIQSLIEGGANPAAQDPAGRRALDWARALGQTEAANQLAALEAK